MKSLNYFLSESYELSPREQTEMMWGAFIKSLYWDINNLGKNSTELEYKDIADICGIPENEMMNFKTNHGDTLEFKIKSGVIRNERKTDWDVISGVISTTENIKPNNYIKFEIATPKNKNTFQGVRNVEIYSCKGVGLYSSNESYVGDDISEFQKVLNDTIKNHLRVK